MRPPETAGLRHVAFNVNDLAICEHFYIELMGMRIEWRPDADNLYLTSGNDNLALHVVSEPASETQHLDHIGFILREPEHVDDWYDFLLAHDVKMASKPKTHRDGARGFYCYDPEGRVVQMIFHPPIAHT